MTLVIKRKCVHSVYSSPFSYDFHLMNGEFEYLSKYFSSVVDEKWRTITMHEFSLFTIEKKIGMQHIETGTKFYLAITSRNGSLK